MSPHPRNGALVVGFILIAAGLLFLIENVFDSFSAWRLIARYWPIILIVVGLKKIYGYFARREGPLVPDGTQKE